MQAVLMYPCEEEKNVLDVQIVMYYASKQWTKIASISLLAHIIVIKFITPSRVAAQ